MSASRCTTPVAAHVREILDHLGVDAAAADDPMIYSALLAAVRSAADDDGTGAGLVRDDADDVRRRLTAGWFRRPAPYMPQSRFSSGGVAPQWIAVSSTFVGGGDKPLGAFWTSSYLSDGSSAWAGVEQVVADGRPRELWEVHLDLTGARVFVIGDNDDYVDLVRRFPLPRGDRLTVRWESVAVEFDAVHLTASGLAETHGATVSDDRRAIALRGWDAECTAWLRFPAGPPMIVPSA